MTTRLHPDPTWPDSPRDEAYSGPLGAYVVELAPYTESHPFAVLLQALAMLGVMVGRGPHFRVSNTRHGLNLFVVVAGSTSEGRKGQSGDDASAVMHLLDPTCPPSLGGLSSGEGLIHAVRDAPVGMAASGPATGGPRSRSSRPDSGVKDKRLLVRETEFASALTVMGRQASTLDTVLRMAWDGASLQVASRHTAQVATDPHIGVIGHITPEELREKLTVTQRHSGFANRFLYALVKRTQTLPHGGRMPEDALQRHRARLRAAVTPAKRVGEMQRSKKADELWVEFYRDLTADAPGIVGSLLSRGAPIVMRLACLYALLDKKTRVQTGHLQAARAVWDYCAESVNYLLGGTAASRQQHKLLTVLRKHHDTGLSQSALRRAAFADHVASDVVRELLLALEADDFVRHEREQTSGRPRTRWFACRS